YLKNNLDNIEIKKKYSIGEIKATSNNNLSELEKIEIIKEERLKEIELLKELINFTDYGLSSIEKEKYKEMVPMMYFEKLKIDEIAEKFNVDERTVKRNRNLLVNIIASNLFESEILQKIKNIFL
ncbi:sigma factor-like helix-turn-helix DNA-binding protein, partial [Fusobacterium nucleatum]